MLEDGTTTDLLADVGGTNTRVALARGGVVDRGSVTKFRNAEFSSLEAVLVAYLSDSGAKPQTAAVAIAGPVRDGTGELTNRAWSFDEPGLAAATGIAKVHILNDLQAQGFGLDDLSPDALSKVVAGRHDPRAKQTRLVVGVGTGFNAAPVYIGSGGRLVVPCESGHVTLPQETEEHRALAKSLEAELGFASVEDALSGRGIEALYRWEGLGPSAQRPSSEIIAALGDGSDGRADEAVRLFTDLLGAAVGNLALTHLPFGGVYLIGGMSRAVAPHFERFGFAARFQDKGRFSDLMEEFPVFVVSDDFAALSGCASFLTELRNT